MEQKKEVVINIETPASVFMVEVDNPTDILSVTSDKLRKRLKDSVLYAVKSGFKSGTNIRLASHSIALGQPARPELVIEPAHDLFGELQPACLGVKSD